VSRITFDDKSEVGSLASEMIVMIEITGEGSI